MPKTNRNLLRASCLLLIVVMTLGVIGCAKKPGAGDPNAGGIATFRLNGDISGMNPLGNTDGNTYQVWAFTAETLIRHTPDNSWTGQLAETWNISPDGKTYTFNLRKNVKWHDGQPFTADDVMFTWELHHDPDVNEENQYIWMVDGEPIEMVKINEHTIEMRLPKPYPAILEELKWFIPVPKHILASVPRKEIATCEWGTKPVFTGPFKWVEYKNGEYIKLERFDEYWGGKPLLDQVVFRVLSDENAAAIALETGQLDWSRITPTSYTKIKAGGKLSTLQHPSGRIILMQFGPKSPNKALFSDVRVRRAMSHLINREQVANVVMGGLVKPAYNVMVPTDIYYTDDVVKYEYSVDKAKQLLADAGWVAGSGGILTKGGKKFETEFIYQSGDALTEQAALMLQNDFAQVGIKLNLRTLERTALVTYLVDENYDLILNGNLMGPDPHRYVWIYGERTPELTDLFARGQIEPDATKRAAIYRDIQIRISEQVENVPFYYPDSIYAHNPKLHVEDAEVHGGVYHFYDAAKIWLDK